MRTLPFLLLLPFVACTGASKDTGAPDDTGETDTDTDTDTDTGTPVTARIAWFDDMSGMDLSPDGTRAVAQRMSSLAGEVLFLDTVTDEVRSVTTLGDATRNLATGLSADGRISALYDTPVVEAGLWTEATGWQDLASPFAVGCDSDNGGGFDLSDDGTVVVGLLWDVCSPAAFRWTEAGGVQVLDILGEASEGSTNAPANRASVVSGDGQVSAGFAAYGPLDRSPTRWTADGAGELLAPDDRDAPGEVLSIDYDGSTLGVLRGYDGYVWTAAGGFVSLGRLETALPSDPVYVNALSADGHLAFGGVGSEFFGLPTAFVWSEALGMRSVQEVATAAGIVVDEGYWLTNVMAVSDDSTVILGRAFNAEGAPTTFVMHVPADVWER
ncbi:MAG: hypothetical protein V4850_08360 [Myxococcota bacterium]